MNARLARTRRRSHDDQLPPTAAAYVRAINDHDAAAFVALFAEAAVVDDAGREFRGVAAIKEWSDREVFAPLVTLEVLGVAERGGETVLRPRWTATSTGPACPIP